MLWTPTYTFSLDILHATMQVRFKCVYINITYIRNVSLTYLIIELSRIQESQSWCVTVSEVCMRVLGEVGVKKDCGELRLMSAYNVHTRLIFDRYAWCTLFSIMILRVTTVHVEN